MVLDYDGDDDDGAASSCQYEIVNRLLEYS